MKTIKDTELNKVSGGWGDESYNETISQGHWYRNENSIHPYFLYLNEDLNLRGLNSYRYVTKFYKLENNALYYFKTESLSYLDFEYYKYRMINNPSYPIIE